MLKEVVFFDWTIKLHPDLNPVVDIASKQIAIIEPNFEFNGLIWLDGKNQLQLKPTWDCIISIDSENKIITFV